MPRETVEFTGFSTFDEFVIQAQSARPCSSRWAWPATFGRSYQFRPRGLWWRTSRKLPKL